MVKLSMFSATMLGKNVSPRSSFARRENSALLSTSEAMSPDQGKLNTRSKTKGSNKKGGGRVKAIFANGAAELLLQRRVGPALPTMGTPLIKLHNVCLDVAVAHFAAAEETLLTIADMQATAHGVHVRHAPIRQGRDHGSASTGRRQREVWGKVFLADTVRG